MPAYLQPLLGYFDAHPYLILFVGLLFVGELVLLPAIYLAIAGRLELAYVICIAVAATSLSDFALYYAGRRFPASALKRIPGHRTSQLVHGLDRLFTRRGARVVFLSKFVYGTRVIAQILAGIHDVPLRAYLTANTLGIAALTLVLSGIAWAVADTAQRYVDVVHGAQYAFVAFVLIAAAGFVGAATVARRRWSR